MRLKRWESPRREGRNDKGRGGAARQRQLKKQRQMLRQKLKNSENLNNNNKNNNQQQGESFDFPLFFVFSTSKYLNNVQKLSAVNHQ